VSEIRPALTAEGWATLSIAPETAPRIVIHDDGDGLEVVIFRDEDRTELLSKHKIERWEPEARHALAALALYQQSFGFTREEAFCLEEVIANFEAFASTEGDFGKRIVEQYSPAATSALAKIRALLPPEP
jgi:hypothetical protein